MASRAWRIFWPVFWTLAATTGLIVLCRVNPEAREVTLDTLKTIFGIVTTPFILETTCIIIGICILMAIRQWQDKKDGDGWVYLATQEPDDKDLPRALTERLQSVVLPEKPEMPDDVLTRRSVIEGYLELGMGAQALAEWNATNGWPDDLASALLHVRVLAVNLDTEPARTALREAAVRFPQHGKMPADAASEIARWFTTHLHRSDLADIWLQEAAALGASLC